MSIINYIAQKKAKFQNKIQSNRTKSIAKKETLLKEMEIKNKVREQDLAIERRFQEEKMREKDLKKESFKNTFAGRVANNIKGKVNESKKQNKTRLSNNNNILTAQNTYSNPFSTSGSIGSAPFSKGSIGRNVFSSTGEIKPKPLKKRVKIIEY